MVTQVGGDYKVIHWIIRSTNSELKQPLCVAWTHTTVDPISDWFGSIFIVLKLENEHLCISGSINLFLGGLILLTSSGNQGVANFQIGLQKYAITEELH